MRVLAAVAGCSDLYYPLIRGVGSSSFGKAHRQIRSFAKFRASGATVRAHAVLALIEFLAWRVCHTSFISLRVQLLGGPQPQGPR